MYSDYDNEQRMKIARYAIDNGPAKAARHFTTVLKRRVNESTVRSIRDSYKKQYKLGQVDDATTTLTPKKRGKPLLMGDFDDDVQRHIRAIRDAGGAVNRTIVIATARGVIHARNRALLAENGGHIHLTRGWAASLMTRMGFVMRKATKAARKVPADLTDLRAEFHQRIVDNIQEHEIPHALIINFDQTGLNIVPSSHWTMNQSGAKQIEVSSTFTTRNLKSQFYSLLN